MATKTEEIKALSRSRTEAGHREFPWGPDGPRRVRTRRENRAATDGPVTVGGWYRLEDGNWQKVHWKAGRMRTSDVFDRPPLDEEVELWAAVDDLECYGE